MKLSKKNLWITAAALALLVSLQLTGIKAMAAPESAEDGAIPEGVVLNYQDLEPIDTSFADQPESEIPVVYGTLPSSYSSSANVGITVDVEKDYVTSVKNQNPYGTCWAHTAISVAETSYIMNYGLNEEINTETIDFSEYHLVHYTYHTPQDPLGLFGGDETLNVSGTTDLDAGGNNIITLSNFANWIGVSDSTDFISSNVGADHDSALGYEDAAHLENGYILTMPDMDSTNYQADMSVVKQMIQEYGSVGISYYASDYSSDYARGYQYCDTGFGVNHAVTVVGWDDEIPADAFPTTAPGDGAWLVKNSWGSNWGINGYFWLSYYDETIDENAVVYDFAASDNYDNNYQYDGAGYILSAMRYTGYSEICQANAFVTDSYEALEAVGFYTLDVDTDYEIRVYRKLGANTLPQRGNLVATVSGNETYAGFHTVKLPEAINLMKGERYAIVITFTIDEGSAQVPVTLAGDSGCFAFSSYAKAGESYLGVSIGGLGDLNAGNTEYADGYNVRIKAFTNEIDVVDVTGVSLNKTTVSLESGASMQLTATVLPSNATFKGVTYKSSDTSLVTVDANGLLRANSTGKSGTATITVTTEYGNKIGTCKVTVQPIKVSKITLSRTSASLESGKTLTLTATVSPSNAGNRAVTWSSSNTKVATVDQNGKITAVGGGTATITVTAKDGSGVKATCKVTVTVVKNGLCQASDGKWYYYVNNKINTNYTGLASNKYGWWYVQNGKLNTGYTGLMQYGSNWWYVQNGQVNFKATGLVQYGGNWWYVQNGAVNFKATGLVQYGGAWWYVQNGAVNFKATGLVQYGGNWWYVQNGAVNFKATGLVQYGGNWWYVQNGAVNFKYTGLVQYGGTWWYVQNGSVNFKATGLVPYGGMYWYVQNGAVNLKYNGMAQYGGTWWYVQNGTINFQYTGVAYNQYGAWYFQNGRLVNK